MQASPPPSGRPATSSQGSPMTARSRVPPSDDDFLFIPPATASSRSPRTARPYTRPVMHKTIVGVGTCGLGPDKQPRRDIHREWLQAKRAAGDTGRRRDDALPAVLSVRDAKADDARRRAEVKEEREVSLEDFQMQCAREKKERKLEAIRAKAEAEEYTKRYVHELVEQERAIRESVKKTRQEEKQLLNTWSQAMAGIRRASPEVAVERRREAVEATVTARSAVEASYPERSPQRHKADLARGLRKVAKEERSLWQQMTDDQRRAMLESVKSTHDRVASSQGRVREAREADTGRKQASASQQRRQQEEYRAKWGQEAAGWRADLGVAVKQERSESQRRAEQQREERADEIARVGESIRAETAKARALRDERMKLQLKHNAAVREAVKSSLHNVEAMQRLVEQRHKEHVRMREDSALLKQTREADIEAERKARRKMYERIMASSTRRSSPSGGSSPARSPKSSARQQQSDVKQQQTNGAANSKSDQ